MFIEWLTASDVPQKGLTKLDFLQAVERAVNHGEELDRANLEGLQVEPLCDLAHPDEDSGPLRTYHIEKPRFFALIRGLAHFLEYLVDVLPAFDHMAPDNANKEGRLGYNLSLGLAIVV